MSNDLLNLTKQEIQKIQYDVLWTSIVNNGYLPASQIEVLNKSLKTDSKIIIKAINEVLIKSEAAQQAVARFKDRFNRIIGDEISDPETAANLEELNKNIINTIHELKQRFIEILAAANESNEKVDEYKHLIDEANQQLDEIIDKYDVAIEVIYPQNNTFYLDKKPILNNNFRIYINGIRYGNDSFLVDLEEKKVQFLFNNSNFGFDLNSNYEVIVEYSYDHND